MAIGTTEATMTKGIAIRIAMAIVVERFSV